MIENGYSWGVPNTAQPKGWKDFPRDQHFFRDKTFFWDHNYFWNPIFFLRDQPNLNPTPTQLVWEFDPGAAPACQLCL